jgi:hypothetical protein
MVTMKMTKWQEKGSNNNKNEQTDSKKMEGKKQQIGLSI